MKVRLNTNVPGHRYGDEVDPAVLGDDFVQELLDAELAEWVKPDPATASAFERFQSECFELADQLAATASRAALLAGLFAELDEGEIDQAVDLLSSAYQQPAEFQTEPVLVMMGAVIERRRDLFVLTQDGRIAAAAGELARQDQDTSGGVSEASAADQAAAPGAEAPGAGPADAPQPTDPAAGAEATANAAGGDVASPHTPPNEAGPSGDATGAGASAPTPAADPAAPAPAKPAAKAEGGAAKAKKPGG